MSKNLNSKKANSKIENRKEKEDMKYFEKYVTKNIKDYYKDDYSSKWIINNLIEVYQNGEEILEFLADNIASSDTDFMIKDYREMRFNQLNGIGSYQTEEHEYINFIKDSIKEMLDTDFMSSDEIKNKMENFDEDDREYIQRDIEDVVTDILYDIYSEYMEEII